MIFGTRFGFRLLLLMVVWWLTVTMTTTVTGWTKMIGKMILSLHVRHELSKSFFRRHSRIRAIVFHRPLTIRWSSSALWISLLLISAASQTTISC
jgi:hypothetical protein